jgi:hypothetical protein
MNGIKGAIIYCVIFCATVIGLMAIAFQNLKHSDSNISITGTVESVDSTSNKSKDWSQIEKQSFVLDIEKMNVVLIKRSFDESGIEVTLIRYQNGSDEYFVCSREIHEDLVRKLQDIINKR